MPARDSEEVVEISTKMMGRQIRSGVRDLAAVSANRQGEGSLPAVEPLKQTPLPLGRPAGSARPIQRGRRTERLRGRRRGQVLVEELRPERGAPALCQRQHLDDLFPAGQRDSKRIPRTDKLGGFGRTAVDIHLPAVAGRRREGPGLEEARRPKPLIHPDSIHRSLLREPPRESNSLPPGGIRPPACPPVATSRARKEGS